METHQVPRETPKGKLTLPWRISCQVLWVQPWRQCVSESTRGGRKLLHPAMESAAEENTKGSWGSINRRRNMPIEMPEAEGKWSMSIVTSDSRLTVISVCSSDATSDVVLRRIKR
jgi:hypothetical protein